MQQGYSWTLGVEWRRIDETIGYKQFPCVDLPFDVIRTDQNLMSFNVWTDEDAEFIATAREALPWYINRCMELQKQNKIMVEVLDQLSKLGNGSRLGNSIGNVIAQDALRKIGKLQLEVGE